MFEVTSFESKSNGVGFDQWIRKYNLTGKSVKDFSCDLLGIYYCKYLYFCLGGVSKGFLPRYLCKLTLMKPKNLDPLTQKNFSFLVGSNSTRSLPRLARLRVEQMHTYASITHRWLEKSPRENKCLCLKRERQKAA